MATLSKHLYLQRNHTFISSINFSWKIWLILVLFFISVLDIICISFWLNFGTENDSNSYLKSNKKQISGLRCPQEAPRPPQGCPRWPSGLLFRPFGVTLAPLSAIGTTFGALLPLRELVLNILGNFWYMLGSSSPQKRQLAHIFANVFSLTKPTLSVLSCSGCWAMGSTFLALKIDKHQYKIDLKRF